MDFKDLLISANKRVEDYYKFKELGMFCKHDDFVPAIHYPPITKYPLINYDEMFKNYTPPANELMDVYIHIPFCTKRCVFCHYPSLYGSSESEKDKYLDAMEKEMDLYLNLLNFDKIKLRVALVGGGTPTDLSPKQLERFLKMFTQRCDMSNLQQFNYDVSPSTLVGKEGIEKLRIMRDYGVDRLSIGIQTLNENIMKKMNRPHDKKIALESINNTLDFGFQLNIEFIYGYPEQTLDSWYKELQEMVTLDAHEIQFYRLKIAAYGDQEGIIKNNKETSPEIFTSIDDTLRMKQMAIDYLAYNGYHENLRRVFTKKKSHISLYAYNQCCELLDQMSLGLTAFSSLRDRFVLNTKDFNEYYERISKGMLPYNRGYVRNADAQQRWAIILPLKNYHLRKNLFKKVTGIEIKETKHYKTIQLLKEYNFVEENEHIIKLTNTGSFFADEVCALFYDSEFIPFERELYKTGPLNPYAQI